MVGVVKIIKNHKIEIRVTEKQKEYIKNKSEDLGYNSMSAYLIDCAYDFFKIDLDLTHFREVSKEINYIGKNINNLVHHMFATSSYNKYELQEIQKLQNDIIKIINKEYDYLLKLRKKYSESNMTINEKKKLIEQLNKHEIEVPKEVLLKEIYKQVRENILYICSCIDSSPGQEEGVSEYVYEYIYDGSFFELDQTNLILFANEIFIFSEKVKMKLSNVNNFFDDEDWWELKDILDKYEQ